MFGLWSGVGGTVHGSNQARSRPGSRRRLGRVTAGILLSQVRLEEKMIFAAAEREGLDLVRVHDKDLILDLEKPAFLDVAVVLDRGLVHSRAEYTLRFLSSQGI